MLQYTYIACLVCLCAVFVGSQWPRGLMPLSTAARLLGIAPDKMDYLSLVNVVCCQVEVSATGRSLVQRSPTDCVCVFLSVSVASVNFFIHNE